MSDRNENDAYYGSADAASKQDEMDQDQGALADQDLDQAAGGLLHYKNGGDAAADSSRAAKNDKPESDHVF
jgi:hypothetical protein